MIIRKYTDGDANLELSVNEEKLILFEIETEGIYLSVALDHDEADDLRDRLYDMLKAINPEKANG